MNKLECFSKCHGEFTGEPGIPEAKNSDKGHTWVRHIIKIGQYCCVIVLVKGDEGERRGSEDFLFILFQT